MADGVPILVKIGVDARNYHVYPDWTLLPLAAAGQTKEEKEALVSAQQIVKWQTDNVFSHNDDGPDSPKGTWLGMMIVTEEYADQAVAMFPGVVTIMKEAEAKAFWEERVYIAVAPVKYDVDYLQGLKLEYELRTIAKLDTVEVEARIVSALDPTTKAPGIRERREVKFDQFKADQKLAIIEKKGAIDIEPVGPVDP